jgi:hypothetical protein
LLAVVVLIKHAAAVALVQTFLLVAHKALAVLRPW